MSIHVTPKLGVVTEHLHKNDVFPHAILTALR